MSLRPFSLLMALALVLCAGVALAVPTDIAVNGGFESGDFTGWTVYPPPSPSSISLVSPGYTGSYAAYLDNTYAPSAAVIKNTNLGVGIVLPGQSVTISFDARGYCAIGGVAFAELFSEIAGGGVSKSQILSGAPLALDANPAVWKHFSFTTTAGSDVSGGLTLQLTATTGAAVGSVAQLYYDNVSVVVDWSVVPVRMETWSRIKTLYR